MRVAPEIVLTDEERAELTRLVRSKLTSVRLAQRARIVLLAADGMQNKDIAEQLGAAAEGMLVSTLAPSAEQNPAIAKFVERWQQTEKRVPNGLPYTQYLYDMPYLIGQLYGVDLFSLSKVTVGERALA